MPTWKWAPSGYLEKIGTVKAQKNDDATVVTITIVTWGRSWETGLRENVYKDNILTETHTMPHTHTHTL